MGQGLASAIHTTNHVLLYDTGPKYSPSFTAGRAIIVPYLRYRGNDRVDIIVQSHGDNDHIGGLNDVMDNIEIGKILTSVPSKTVFSNVEYCRDGQSWVWDEVRFEMLHPAEIGKFHGNNASCVLRVSHGTHSILMTGDIEAKAERALLSMHEHEISSSMLIVPHHGSRTSSTAALVRAVSPEYVVFSSRYLNRFGFPKQDIITRYEEIGARLLNTADSGAISMQVRSRGISITRQREKSRKFWNTRAE
mgnify:CR=1 FL=1